MVKQNLHSQMGMFIEEQIQNQKAVLIQSQIRGWLVRKNTTMSMI